MCSMGACKIGFSGHKLVCNIVTGQKAAPCLRIEDLELM